MRIVADTVRGKDVFEALNILRFSAQDASIRLEKLLRSAIANWEAKNEGKSPEDAALTVREISVDSARMLKRIQPASRSCAQSKFEPRYYNRIALRIMMGQKHTL